MIACDSFIDCSIKPQRPDVYAKYRQISILRFVREREVGTHGTIPPRMNIKFCSDISQWSQRIYDACESSICPQLTHEQAENRFAQYWRRIQIHSNLCKPSLLINLVLERGTFIEVVLYKDVRLSSPAAEYERFKNPVENNFIYTNMACYLFELTSYNELVNILLRSERVDDDDDYMDEVVAEFVAHMRKQYISQYVKNT